MPFCQNEVSTVSYCSLITPFFLLSSIVMHYQFQIYMAGFLTHIPMCLWPKIFPCGLQVLETLTCVFISCKFCYSWKHSPDKPLSCNIPQQWRQFIMCFILWMEMKFTPPWLLPNTFPLLLKFKSSPLIQCQDHLKKPACWFFHWILIYVILKYGHLFFSLSNSWIIFWSLVL